MSRHKQQGVVLYVALVVLVVMMGATVAILRSTSSGQNIAGNIGFRQNAESVSGEGTEMARAWLMAPAQTDLILGADITAQGYFATWNGGVLTAGAAFNPVDPAVFNWKVAGESLPGPVVAIRATLDDGTGNEVRYVIHRMCPALGSTTAVGQECAFPPPPVTWGSHWGSGPAATTLTKPFFRITVRTTGPRNTVSVTQTMLFQPEPTLAP